MIPFDDLSNMQLAAHEARLKADPENTPTETFIPFGFGLTVYFDTLTVRNNKDEIMKLIKSNDNDRYERCRP